MDHQEYTLKFKSNFLHARQITIEGLDTLAAYEEVFKWQWLATKLKIFSFVSHADRIDENLMRRYTEACLNYACKNKQGLPRGIQNGVVSYRILSSETVAPSAISFVSNRPGKHWSAFEIPIILDLSTGALHYYEGNIVWGAIYDSFLNEYILRNFTF